MKLRRLRRVPGARVICIGMHRAALAVAESPLATWWDAVPTGCPEETRNVRRRGRPRKRGPKSRAPSSSSSATSFALSSRINELDVRIDPFGGVSRAASSLFVRSTRCDCEPVRQGANVLASFFTMIRRIARSSDFFGSTVRAFRHVAVAST